MVGLVALTVASLGFAAETKERRVESTIEYAQPSSDSVLNAETVSIALAPVATKSQQVPEKSNEKSEFDLPVSGTAAKGQENVSESTVVPDEPLTNKDFDQQQVEKSSPSRASTDDVVREIVVLDKETGSRYKVITVKFPYEGESATSATSETAGAKPVVVETNKESVDDGLDEEENEQPSTSGAEDEETKTEEKDAAKKSKKTDSSRSEEKSRKVEKKNEKKKDKEPLKKDKTGSEKVNGDKSNPKTEKKRSKRSTYGKKSSKGKDRYASKNHEKKYKSKSKN